MSLIKGPQTKIIIHIYTIFGSFYFVKLQFDQLEVDWLEICRILYDGHLVKDDHF